MWLKQANAALDGYHSKKSSTEEVTFYRGKLVTCRWYYLNEVKKISQSAKLVKDFDDTNNMYF